MIHRLRNHLLHLGLGHIHRRMADLHHLVLTGFGIPCQHLQNPIRINLKLHPHPRTSFGTFFKIHLKLPQRPVIPRHLPLPLQHPDAHARLIRHRIGEQLPRPRGDGGIARQDHIHQPAEGLDPQRQRRHIQQHHLPQRS